MYAQMGVGDRPQGDTVRPWPLLLNAILFCIIPWSGRSRLIPQLDLT